MLNQARFGTARPLAALVLLALAGCNSGQSSVESFTPEADQAREALKTGLTAWQNGQPGPGLIEGSKPPVQVLDASWKSGSKLKSFEIGEQLPGDNPRKFKVTLTLEGAKGPQEVVYVVVGKEPLNVMPEKEYNRTSDM